MRSWFLYRVGIGTCSGRDRSGTIQASADVPHVARNCDLLYDSKFGVPKSYGLLPIKITANIILPIFAHYGLCSTNIILPIKITNWEPTPQFDGRYWSPNYPHLAPTLGRSFWASSQMKKSGWRGQTPLAMASTRRSKALAPRRSWLVVSNMAIGNGHL